jgi:hypothetical protein
MSWTESFLEFINQLTLKEKSGPSWDQLGCLTTLGRHDLPHLPLATPGTPCAFKTPTWSYALDLLQSDCSNFAE